MVTMVLQELILGVRSLRAILEKGEKRRGQSGEEQKKSKSRRADETHASLSSRSPGTSISSLSLRPFPLLSSSKLIGVDWESTLRERRSQLRFASSSTEVEELRSPHLPPSFQVRLVKEDLDKMIRLKSRMIDDIVEEPRQSSSTLFQKRSVGSEALRRQADDASERILQDVNENKKRVNSSSVCDSLRKTRESRGRKTRETESSPFSTASPTAR